MERPTCKTCPHWDSMGDPDHVGDQLGECQRYPRVLMYVIQEGTGKLLQHWVFPEMDDWDSCGEHPDFPAYLAGLKGVRGPR